MWLFALAAYLANVIKVNHFAGISLSVLYLILINPPTLLILKRITNMRLYGYASLLINFLEILGYTAILYSLGGIEATFLTPIYAALITYVGVMGPRNYTYVIAFLCSAAFSFVVGCEYFGLIPHQTVVPSFNPTPLTILSYLSVAIGLLFVVAYVSSLTSGILKKNRSKLREQNLELIEKAALLEKVEENLRTAHHELENRVAELREANDQLRREIRERRQAEEERRSLEERLSRAEKMESLGILAGGVAHDLNNVLGIVVGYAELLLMGADKSSPIRSKLVNIMEGGQKAAMIVGDLLTLARRGVSGRDVLNLNKIFADWQKSPEFEKLTSYHSAVKIKTDLDPDLLNISASSVHLGKTIFNLVSNASEAMPKGGVLTIKTANRYLDKPIQGYDKIQEGDYVVLSVSDTGEGINEADLKRIFEPFYTKKVMGRSGTGLGLVVVWGTVKEHNGYINVQSEEGKGSTFVLYFPVTREELSAEHVAVSVSEYIGKGESILIVDDVKGQRDLAEEMLRKLNYVVASVSSGEEAVSYLKEHKADLMVLDMIMDPGMDGLDTYRSVLEICPEQRAIIVSGFSESERVKAAQALGAGAYARKPYVIEKLGMAVRKELDRSTWTRED